MSVGAVIVAAGKGTRAGGDIPKQWRRLAGKTVVEHTLSAFQSHSAVTEVVVVLNPDDFGADYLPELGSIAVTQGGDTRSASVMAGLNALSNSERVLIHDAARPCVSEQVISEVVNALDAASAAAPALAVVDALWTGANGRVTGTADRSGLFRAQTPQGFDLKAIIRAHEQFPGGAADDVEIARRAGMDVVITQGDENNLKITTPADFARAEAILKGNHGY